MINIEPKCKSAETFPVLKRFMNDSLGLVVLFTNETSGMVIYVEKPNIYHKVGDYKTDWANFSKPDCWIKETRSFLISNK